MSNENVKRVIREYGQAMRGSWADIDGRTVRQEMETIASWIDNPRVPSLLDMRADLCICPKGFGHWTEFCDTDCGGVE